MDELLHHWQISLISQGRVWVYCIYTGTCTYTPRHTHTDTQECAQTGTRSYTHAFYQSNLVGKSMLWLANRDLMQSRGPSSPLPPPVSILTYLSLSCPSPPLPSSLSPFLSCIFLWKTRKQHLHTVCRQAGEPQPEDWWSQRQSLDFSWLFIK